MPLILVQPPFPAESTSPSKTSALVASAPFWRTTSGDAMFATARPQSGLDAPAAAGRISRGVPPPAGTAFSEPPTT
jgi:hypothetical protein